MGLVVRRSYLLVWAVAAVIVIAASAVHAQDINTTIDLSYDYGRTIDDEAATDIRTHEFKQKYQIDIKAPLTIKFESNGKATLEVENKSETEAASTAKVTPSAEAAFKSDEMEGKGGIKFVYEHSAATEEEDETNKKGWDNYLEYKFKEDRFPDLSLKYTYKTQYDTTAAGSAGGGASTEEVDTDTVDKELTGTIDHDIGDLKIKIEYKDTRGEDRLVDAEDSASTELKAEASYKTKILRDVVDTEISYKYDDKDEETLLDDGTVTELTETKTHEAEGKVKATFEPLPRTKFEPEYDYKYIRDVIEESDEIDQTIKGVITQGLLDWLELKATGERKITETKGVPEEDSHKVEDTLTGEMKGNYDWWLDVNGKFELKDTSEDFVDETKEDTFDRSISYEANWKAKWLDLLDPALSYSRKNEYERENHILASTEDKVKGQFNVSLGTILKVEPNYEWTLTDEYDVDTTALTSEKTTGDFKIKVTLDYGLSDYTKFKFSHQYGHKTETTEEPSEPTTEVISIDEDTKASLEVQDIWPGFKTTAEFTRKASDKNDDDEELKVDLTYSLKVDGAFDRWKYNATLDYDNKGGGDADGLGLELKVDWEYNELKVGGSYTFDHTYATLDQLGKDEHKVGVKLSYKF